MTRQGRQSKPSSRRRLRTAKFALSISLPRAELIQMCDELKSRNPRISERTRTFLRWWLVQIINQLPPKRNTRVNVSAWQIAMLANELVDKRLAFKKVALLTAIETLAPEKATDAKFREFIARTCRKLQSGHNPARSLLLPVPPAMLDLAREKLPKH